MPNLKKKFKKKSLLNAANIIFTLHFIWFDSDNVRSQTDSSGVTEDYLIAAPDMKRGNHFVHIYN